MSLPKVSIMIPTYNQPNYILKAVQSALAQNYPNKEIIISDDSTNDKTKDLLNSFIEKGQVKYYKNEPRLGRTQNYYKSLREYTTGEWVLNIDGDDFLENNFFIAKAIDLILENSDLVAVFGKEKYLKENMAAAVSRDSGIMQTQIFEGNKIFFEKRELGLNFYHLSTLYNKDKAIEVGFYEDDCLGSDTISLMKILINNRVAFLNEFCGVWRVHGSNDSYTSDVNQLMSNIEALYGFSKFLSDKGFSKNKVDKWLEKTVLNRVLIYQIQFLKNRELKLFFLFSKELQGYNKHLFYKSISNIKNLIKYIIIIISPKIYKAIK